MARKYVSDVTCISVFVCLVLEFLTLGNGSSLQKGTWLWESFTRVNTSGVLEGSITGARITGFPCSQ